MDAVRARLISLLALPVLAGLGSAQFPLLPERPARSTREGSRPGAVQPPSRKSPLRFPLPGRSPTEGTVPAMPVTGPRGTAPRLGTGMGLWEALIAMTREEGGKALDLGAVPDRSLLLRYSDIVGVRAEGERGWEILPWWRKVRLLEPGYQVTLSHRGRALQIFYDGALLDVRAPSRWEVVRLDRGIAFLRFRSLHSLFAEAAERLVRLELPGGYVVDLQGCQFTLGFERGRFRAANLGPKPVVIHDRKKEIHLGWNEGCILPVFQGPTPLPLPPLGGEGGRVKALGKGTLGLAWSESLEARPKGLSWIFGAPQAPGKVRWGGCAFALSKGQTLEIRAFRKLPFQVIREAPEMETASAGPAVKSSR